MGSNLLNTYEAKHPNSIDLSYKSVNINTFKIFVAIDKLSWCPKALSTIEGNE